MIKKGLTEREITHVENVLIIERCRKESPDGYNNFYNSEGHYKAYWYTADGDIRAITEGDDVKNSTYLYERF